MTNALIVFEHREFGTLLVLDMIDDDEQTTDLIEDAVQVICPLSDGTLLAACTCCAGKLHEIKVH